MLFIFGCGSCVSRGSSTVILDDVAIHLVYIVEGPVLFLIAAPSTWYTPLVILAALLTLIHCIDLHRCTSIELQMTAKQLGSLFRFQYGSIRRSVCQSSLIY